MRTLILLVLLSLPQGAWAAPRAWSAEVMATRIDVQFAGGTGTEADAQAVFQIFRDVDAVDSEWKDGSPLAALNARAGQPAEPVPAELFSLLQRSVELARITAGAFDPTWAALWGLWDFRAASPAPPSPEDRAARVARIDWTKLALDAGGKTAGIQEGVVVGLGGIAKGWALDRSVALLAARGVTDYVLSAGGQVYAVGQTAAGRPWNVGIRDPRGARWDDYFAIVSVSGASVSTSGDYERWFEHDGVRYHHILDPRTGLPGRLFRSVTVISPDATEADALSTALMLLPLEDGMRIAKEQEVDAVWVDAEGVVHRTPGLGSRYVERHPPAQGPSTD